MRPVNERGLYERDGKEYVSVTTVQGLIHKPALMQWAANEAVDYLRTVGKVVDSGVYQVCDEELDDAKTAYKRKSEAAMDVGTMLHNAVEAHLRGQEPYLANEQLNKMFTAWQGWADKNMVECVEPEQQVFCDRTIHVGLFPIWAGYAGTMDFNGVARPKYGRKMGAPAKCVLDWKTSSGIYGDDYFVQCMAYERAKKIGAEFVGVVRVDKKTMEVEYRCKRVEELEQKFQGYLKLVDFWWLTKGQK